MAQQRAIDNPDVTGMQPQTEQNPILNGGGAGSAGPSIPIISDVGHMMVRAGKAQHPHWRSGAKGNKHAKRMYANADVAHAHTKVKP